MSRIKLLDCTLRDGGYVNDWHFGKETIKTLITGLTTAKIDIIECGFLIDHIYDEQYSLFSDTKEVTTVLENPDPSILYVAMIAIGEKEINPIKLSMAEESPIKGVRLTFHQHEIEKSFYYAHILMDKGYQVFMQPVGSANYEDQTLMDLIKRINDLKPHAFYLVDTLGTMYQNDVRRLLYLLDNNLDQSVALGLHSHNNLQMSFANAQDLISFCTARTILIDTSIYGMGRGAGNLCTELLTDYLNTNYKAEYEVLPLLECIDECLMPIYIQRPWGYSVAYFLASSKNCHPNYASYLLSKQTVSVRTISTILDEIPMERRFLFDKKYIEALYQSYQKHNVDDLEVLKQLRNEMKGKEVLVIGTGKAIKEEHERIATYIEEKHPYVIAVNSTPKFEVDLFFISNERRYRQLEKSIDHKKAIFTSNLMNLKQKVRYVNYAELLNTSMDVSDQAGMMVLKLLVKTSAKSVVLAGFDGFSENQVNNYSEDRFIGSSEPEELSKKNEANAIQIKKRAKDYKISFLTKSLYNQEVAAASNC
ncbi:aldolase catalytic domain-containing protein [Anaerosporobacter sp.]|uniref:aldolase catalytic domain-containing protein n=1 Tax=Anaerosporobacter sp. TaxID=1872529 RepID=UPI00286F8EE4|nr:aldolase catalytic domain-containing protein [Anaerosporobacter sp.]